MSEPPHIDPPPEILFRVDTVAENDVVRLAVTGDLDLSTVPTLEQEAHAALLAHRPARLVVDLREATFLDSTGIRLLLALEHDARDSGYRFTLVRGPIEVERALEVTGVRDTLEIIDDPPRGPQPG